MLGHCKSIKYIEKYIFITLVVREIHTKKPQLDSIIEMGL